MLEKFGNPNADDLLNPVRKSFSRMCAARPPPTPVVWDTPFDPETCDTDDNVATGGTPNRFFNRGNERLYEAYSQLHNMAQEFDKPFDSPAILVVGHQTDGKSALVEALMGFQFNHVGGGTKTRRPIAINMKYNASCVDPRCFLLKEDSFNGGEEEMSLPDLQRYIESENARLENDNGFWAKDIVVRIEYKYCPNLTIIDTPGLIAAAPGRKHIATQQAARSVETLVRAKMAQRDYIILCLEDNSDWNNATTRRVVLDADPELRRTVVVSTKFDTRIPQFSRASDVELFMKPPGRLLEQTLLGGGPFFTSVPSGRVGGGRDCLFRSNEQYREAVAQQEKKDTGELERRCDRRLAPNERSRVGVSQLRHFLERLLQQRYLENVPTIVPTLEREHRAASLKLRETDLELKNLDTDKLKEKGRAFYQHFLEKIPELLRGTMAAPPRVFGETLAHEHIRGGAFVTADGRPADTSAPYEVANGEMRLFGGKYFSITTFRRPFAHTRLTLSFLSLRRAVPQGAGGIQGRGQRGAVPYCFTRGHYQQLRRGRGARRGELHANRVRHRGREGQGNLRTLRPPARVPLGAHRPAPVTGRDVPSSERGPYSDRPRGVFKTNRRLLRAVRGPESQSVPGKVQGGPVVHHAVRHVVAAQREPRWCRERAWAEIWRARSGTRAATPYGRVRRRTQVRRGPVPVP
jgi:hypothetical protein